jgi:Tfp pilus assembly protein PilN
LDIENIKRIHEDNDLIIYDPYLPREKAILMLQAAHHHRSLLLAAVDLLRLVQAQRDEQNEYIRQLEREVENLKARLIAVAEIV